MRFNCIVCINFIYVKSNLIKDVNDIRLQAYIVDCNFQKTRSFLSTVYSNLFLFFETTKEMDYLKFL